MTADSVGAEPIPGCKHYFINLHGQVFSIKSGVFKELKTHRDIKGYRRITIKRTSGKSYAANIHRLLLMTFSVPPETLEARHLNGDNSDNRLENLDWGTVRDNAQDRARHGTLLVGGDCNLAKLSEPKVREIKTLFDRGVSQVKIGKMFGVVQSTIALIKSRKTWAHLK